MVWRIKNMKRLHHHNDHLVKRMPHLRCCMCRLKDTLHWNMMVLLWQYSQLVMVEHLLRVRFGLLDGWLNRFIHLKFCCDSPFHFICIRQHTIYQMPQRIKTVVLETVSVSLFERTLTFCLIADEFFIVNCDLTSVAIMSGFLSPGPTLSKTALTLSLWDYVISWVSVR